MSKLRTIKPDEKSEELLLLLIKHNAEDAINHLLNDISKIRFKHEDDRIWWALVKEIWDETTKANDQR